MSVRGKRGNREMSCIKEMGLEHDSLFYIHIYIIYIDVRKGGGDGKLTFGKHSEHLCKMNS